MAATRAFVFSAVLVFLSFACLAAADCTLCNLDLPGLITYHGYPVEHHSFIPEDNTVTLNVYRIPGPRGSSGTGKRGPPVLLQHGLLDSGTTWVVNPPTESLAFILADAGYDVWIGNNRGNDYSPCQTDACWSFSFDEMALYDLPSFVGYVINNTGFSNVSYVGHSEGTTQAFASFSYIPSIASRINLFVALAPVAFVNHQESPLVTVLADLGVVGIFELFGVKNFLPESPFLKLVAELFCDGGLFTPICEDLIFALCGVDPSTSHDVNQTRLEVYLAHTPAGTSVQNMAHWSQAVNAPAFQMFDFGSSGNMAHYGQSTPPIYDLTKFSVPTALFNGGQDFLGDPEDFLQLTSVLPAAAQVFHLYEENYSHLDFVWGVDAGRLIYPSIVSLLNKFAPIS